MLVSISSGRNINSQLTVSVDKQSTNHSPASSAKTMMDTLKNTLRAGTKLRRCVVRYVTAARGPDSGVSYSLDEFER